MSNALRDQLVKAGLANKQSANTLNAKSRKKHKKPRGETAADITAKQAADAKREKDKALNAARQAQQQKVAIKAQIKVLIETHAIKEYSGEIAYNYIAGTKVRQLYVQQPIHAQLSSGTMAITRLNGKTYLVPVEIAQKILTLNPQWAVTTPGESNQESPDDDDDPYANYQIPDDLSW